MGLAEFIANQRVLQSQAQAGPRTMMRPAPSSVPARGYQLGGTVSAQVAPAPGTFDRSQPVNPLEQQLAVRRMLDGQARGMGAGVGYDVTGAPSVVPLRQAVNTRQFRDAMPAAQRTPVQPLLYGGR